MNPQRVGVQLCETYGGDINVYKESVDGGERVDYKLQLWKSVQNQGYKPSLVILAYNAKLPPSDPPPFL